MGAANSLEQVFWAVLTLSAQASVLVVLVLLTQRLLGRRLSPGWHLALWALLLVRLLLPWSPEAACSLYNLQHAAGWFTPDETAPPADFAPAAQASPVIEFSAEASPQASAHAAAASPGDQAAASSLPDYLPHLWLAGVLLFLAAMLWQNGRITRRLACGEEVVNAEALALYERCKRDTGVKGWLPLGEAEGVRSPVLLGALRPRLVLPKGFSAAAAPQALRHVFLHELTHYRRGDIWLNWLAHLLLALHWFNPFMWWAVRRIRSDQELACDAQVLALLTGEEQIRYGHTLLTQFENCRNARWAPGFAGISEHKSNLERRLTMIANFTPASRWTALAGIAAVLTLGLLALTDAKAQTDQDLPDFVPETSTLDGDGRIVDKIDLPFEDDPKVVGAWESVDFVSSPEQFKPGQKQWQGDLYLKELVFLPDGKTHKPFWTWTGGYLMHTGNKTAAQYEIVERGGAQYMFLEWKSGDYTIRHQKTKYYVLRKTDPEPAASAQAAAGQYMIEAQFIALMGTGEIDADSETLPWHRTDEDEEGFAQDAAGLIYWNGKNLGEAGREVRVFNRPRLVALAGESAGIAVGPPGDMLEVSVKVSPIADSEHVQVEHAARVERPRGELPQQGLADKPEREVLVTESTDEATSGSWMRHPIGKTDDGALLLLFLRVTPFDSAA